MTRIALALICLIGAGSVSAEDPVRFDFDALNGVEVWPDFELEQIQCLFPQAILSEQAVPTRFDDGAADAVVWLKGDDPLVVFEAVDAAPLLFSIWTEHPDVIGPYGWQVGSTTLGQVQAELGTCIRGYTAASDRVVCSLPRHLGLPASLVFKDIPGAIDIVPSGAYDPAWGDARLSRIERYRGDAPSQSQSCVLNS